MRIDDRTKGQESRPEGYLISFRGVFNHVLDVSQPRSGRIATTFRTYRNHVPNVSQPRPERITTTFRTYRNHVPNVSRPRSERIATTFRTYHNHVPNVSQPCSGRIATTFRTYYDHLGTLFPPETNPKQLLRRTLSHAKWRGRFIAERDIRIPADTELNAGNPFPWGTADASYPYCALSHSA